MIRRPDLALTFDDGPHPRLTPRLLALLRRHGMTATFFLIGRQVARFPGLARRIAAEGHAVGNHTLTHPYLDRLDDAEVLAEVDLCAAELARAGITTRLFRPPYGALRPKQAAMLERERGLQVTFWTADARDWENPPPALSARRLARRARPGAVLLAHDIFAPTIPAMALLLPELRRLGLTSRALPGGRP